MTLQKESADIDAEGSHVRLSLWQFGSILTSIIGGTILVGGLLVSIRMDIARLDGKYSQVSGDLARIETERAQVVREWGEWRIKVDARNEAQNLDIRTLQLDLKNHPR